MPKNWKGTKHCLEHWEHMSWIIKDFWKVLIQSWMSKIFSCLASAKNNPDDWLGVSCSQTLSNMFTSDSLRFWEKDLQGGHGVLDHGDSRIQKRVNWICVILCGSSSCISDRTFKIIALLFSIMALPSLCVCWTQGRPVRSIPWLLVLLFHVEPSRQIQDCASNVPKYETTLKV